ncbi:MAG: N-acetyl-gamma-glutamyl-phosphate reductase [Burkholderiales bacterium]
MIIKASIIGASGYTGVELIRLLSQHPQVEISQLISETYQDQSIAQVFPHLTKAITADFTRIDPVAIAATSNVVFLALPHTAAAPLAEKLLAKGCKVIDLSADLRLKDGATYQQWYQHAPASPELLQTAVYGLAEIGKRKQIAAANLIANPGCYPTASILALAPLLVLDMVDLQAGPIILDAKSGVSGAGRSLSLATHFCEISNSLSAYQIAGIHRHIPEIEQELSLLAHQQLTIQFTPHLVPMPRGLMVTAYCKLKQVTDLEQIYASYANYYQDSFFVRLTKQDLRSSTKAVIGTNFCNISLHLDRRTNYVVIVSVIDNLLKGASAQAVQNMNLMYGLTEHLGLEHIAIYP